MWKLTDHVKIKNANPNLCVSHYVYPCTVSYLRSTEKMAYIVYPIMRIPSCVSHHVYVYHHVYTIMCITFARHIICTLIPHSFSMWKPLFLHVETNGSFETRKS